MKSAVIGCLCAGALAVVGCADGRGVPSSPVASSAVAPANEGTARPAGAASLSASPRSADLHVTKECSQFNGTDGTFCTITSSNLAAIEVGSRVIYATVNGFGALDSDVVLDLPGPGNNAASGHCTLNASVSRCEFSGGTGKFTHFHATVAVSYLGGPDYGWDGSYSFNPHD